MILMSSWKNYRLDITKIQIRLKFIFESMILFICMIEGQLIFFNGKRIKKSGLRKI